MTTQDNQVEIIDSGEGKVPFIGKHCAIFREMNGWNQDVLGEKLNVSQQTVSKYENARELPLYMVRKIAEVFGVNIYYLTEAKENELKSVYQNNAYDNAFTQSNNVLWSSTVNVNPANTVKQLFKGQVDILKGQLDRMEQQYNEKVEENFQLRLRIQELEMKA